MLREFWKYTRITCLYLKALQRQNTRVSITVFCVIQEHSVVQLHVFHQVAYCVPLLVVRTTRSHVTNDVIP